MQRLERMSVIWAVLALASLAMGRMQDGPYSIEDALSAPFPSDLTPAPDGRAIAWVRNDQGRRDIWIASPPKYVGRQLTNYDADDGQIIGSLAWTPDAGRIIYVRGGEPNRNGEIPNPLSKPGGTKRQIWMIGLEGGDPALIATGHSPLPLPDGSGVLFLDKGQVWQIAFDAADGGDEEKFKPESIIHARGSTSNLRFSPDGRRLAFKSDRGNHSFIGVYDLASKELRYLDASVDHDDFPVWSPDSTRLVYQRFPADTPPFILFGPQREANPWSIRVVDVDSGLAREIWKAEKGAGSAYSWIGSDDQLFWGADDRIVFCWERTGWKNLYSVGLEGSSATPLTPGEFEVEHVRMTRDRTAMIYSSNQGDIDRRHLWRVSVAAGPPVALTQGVGSEFFPAPISNDGFVMAYSRSGGRTPTHAAIRVGAAADRALAPDAIPDSFPQGDLVEPEQVIFTSADGMKIHGQLFLPPNHEAGEKHPAMLFFHGGSRRQMLLGFHYRGYYHNCYSFNQFLASRGYVVMSVNYRSGISYGLEFREALNYGATGASEFNDVLGAAFYLQGRDDVDASRIGLWGGSYGGYLTAMGLARASGLFAAGVDLHGAHDWNVTIAGFRPSYKTIEHPEAAQLAFDSSPMSSLDTWKSPVLLIHGDDDRNVAFIESITLTEELRKRDVHVEHLIFPDEVHGFLLHRNWVRAYETAYDFLDRMLGEK